MKLNSAPIFGGDCLSHFFMVSPTDSYLPKSPGRLNAPGGGGQARMTARPLYDLLLVLSSFWTTHARTPRVSKKAEERRHVSANSADEEDAAHPAIVRDYRTRETVFS